MITAMPGMSAGYMGYKGPPPPGMPSPLVTWSADSRLLATFARNFGGSIWLIDPKTGGHLRMLAPHADSMAWSPSASMLAMHINASAEIWGSNSGPPP
jgi:sugar lactone lactonase YvrE